MNSEPITQLLSDSLIAAIPEGSLSVSQWADQYRFLSPERSERAGRWTTSLVPYLREIMDEVSNPETSEVVLVKSSQIAGTEFANNVIGYYMHIDPSPILYVCENQEKAEAWSKECLAPMIRDSEALRLLVRDSRTRDSHNTITAKQFPGGHLAIAWATSPATLSSRPRRLVILDEKDAFKPSIEGDPGDLAIARTKTFTTTKKIVKISSPRERLENPPNAPADQPRRSPIERDYDNSDRRKYEVPCPDCGEFQVLKWSNVKWEDEPLLAYYVCDANGCVIEHDSKAEMLAAGRWIAEKPFRGRAGFWINEIYSPFVTWAEMAERWTVAKKDIETLKTFVNTSLAEGWEPLDGEISTADLIDRQEDYDDTVVPEDVLVLTAGVDVQGNRLELEIRGYGPDHESWGIDYLVLPGDPSQAEIWSQLKTILTTPYKTESGRTISISAIAIDSGGHHTHEVYKFIRANSGRRWYAVKGANTPGKPLVPRKPSIVGRPPVRLYVIGTETAKDSIAARLLIAKPGPGYCHFPQHYPAEYFKQLRAEKPITRYVRGVGIRKWEKIKPSFRNEALDCFVYNEAALAIFAPNLRRLAAKKLGAQAPTPEDLEHDGDIDKQIDTDPELAERAQQAQEIDQEQAERTQQARRRRGFTGAKKGNFATNWGGGSSWGKDGD
jgi:phage terminase large subunit GpA-like protein